MPDEKAETVSEPTIKFPRRPADTESAFALRYTKVMLDRILTILSPDKIGNEKTFVLRDVIEIRLLLKSTLDKIKKVSNP